MATNSKKTQAYASSLLDQLVQLDQFTQHAFYEMGRILTAISRDKLYKIIGFPSMTALIEEELSFTPSTAGAYIKLYKNCKRLQYSDKEAVGIINEFGLRHLNAILPKEDKKLGTRAIANRVKALDEKQFTIWVHKKEYEEIEDAMLKMGGMKEESGKWKNSSEALLNMARAVNAMKVPKAA
jgi:hypothetical protein